MEDCKTAREVGGAEASMTDSDVRSDEDADADDAAAAGKYGSEIEVPSYVKDVLSRVKDGHTTSALTCVRWFFFVSS